MSTHEQANLRSLSDEALALRATEGCLKSFDILVARFQVPLLHYLQHRAKSREDAEDLVQEAFLRAYRNLHRYEDAWRFSTWLYTIAHRLSINAFRREGRMLDRSDNEGTLATAESAECDPAVAAAQADTGQRLWAVVAQELGEPKFTAIWLFYGEGMPISQIAEVLERTSGAIKTMLLRARRQLIPALRGQWESHVGGAPRSANNVEEKNPCGSKNSGVG